MREAISQRNGYGDGVLHYFLSQLTSFFSILSGVIILNQVSGGKKVNKIAILSLVGYTTLALLGSRTRLVGYIFILIVFTYSCYKDKIRWQHITKVGLPLVLILYFVFNFALVFRSTIRILGAQQKKLTPIEVVKQSLTNFDKRQDTNHQITSRSLAVFAALSKSFTSEYEPGKGELTKSSISVGIPKVIYPNKNPNGSQLLIESKLGTESDTADSFLMFSRVEWGSVFGAFWCFLMYISTIYFWYYSSLLLRYIFDTFSYFNLLVEIFPIICTINLVQFIEASPDSISSSLIRSPLIYSTILAILFLSKKLFGASLFTLSKENEEIILEKLSKQ
ncbi:hypothetical protein [Mangrovibacterium diazotrophicum]|nr:hypothetical protein [Mangrovibacterium diazotrophicum]